MTDAASDVMPLPADGRSALTRRRYAAEKRFRVYGMVAVAIGIAALVFLLWSVLDRGLPAFTQTFIRADITLDPTVLDPKGNRDPEEMKKVLTFGYGKIIKDSLTELSAELQASGAPGITPALLAGMISEAAPAQLRNFVLANPDAFTR